MIAVVELLRVSTDSQASEGSANLPAQHSVNVRTCAQYDLEIVETVEIVESGAEVARTPEMARVLDCVTGRRASGIVLAEYSRLFRPDRWSDMIVLQTLADHNAPIYLPNGPIDLQSEVGYVQATINNLLAAMERRRIRERMDRGKEELRRRGAHVAGGIGIPYGVKYSKEGGWEWTEDAAIVRELFRRFLAGERTYDALGKALGLPRTTTKFLLTNPIYTGWRVYSERHDMTAQGKYHNSRYRKKVARRPDDVIRVRLPLEPIVSEAEFALVQELIRQKAGLRVRRSNRNETFLYGGLLAHECGLPMYTFSNGRGHHFYYCRSKNPNRTPKGLEPCADGYLELKRIEGLLDSAISERLTDADLLSTAIADYLDEERSGSAPAVEVDLGAMDARLKSLEQKRGRILETYYDGQISKSERDRRLGQLDDELATTRRMMTAVVEEDEPDLSDQVVLSILDLFKQWPMVDRVGRRSILEALAPTFYVRKYEVLGVNLPLSLVSGGDSDNDSRRADAVTTWGLQHFRNSGGLYVPLSA